MKTINLSMVRDRIKDVVQEANFELQKDVLDVICDMKGKEESPAGKAIFDQILENVKIAKQEKMGLCQDTGLAVFFVELGEEVELNKDDGLKGLHHAIEEGVRAGYEEGYLRKSVVEHPYKRVNTKDNTPAIAYYKLVEGDKLKIRFAAKGGGRRPC